MNRLPMRTKGSSCLPGIPGDNPGMYTFDQSMIPPEDITDGIPHYHGCMTELLEYTRGKHDLLAALELPRGFRVIEIGFRLAYGAHAFVSARPDIKEYHAFDRDPCATGLKSIRERFPGVEFTLDQGNTFHLQALGYPAEFIHVDGGHRYHECAHDLVLADQAVVPGGYIVIDDCNLSRVKKACDDFLQGPGALRYEKPRFVQTLRGDLVLRRSL